MPRIEGIKKGGSIMARLAFLITRRKLGKVIRPVRVHSMHPRLLYGYAQMEMAQEKARHVPAAIRSLAQIRVAMRIGCPF